VQPAPRGKLVKGIGKGREGKEGRRITSGAGVREYA